MDGRLCVAHGFRAVRPDNLDSWTRSRGQLDQSDAVAMSRILVRQAHRRGLAVAQKNTAELASRRGTSAGTSPSPRVPGLSRCGVFTRAYGARVIEIEYSRRRGRANFDRACGPRRRISVLYRDRNLVRAGCSAVPGSPPADFQPAQFWASGTLTVRSLTLLVLLRPRQCR